MISAKVFGSSRFSLENLVRLDWVLPNVFLTAVANTPISRTKYVAKFSKKNYISINLLLYLNTIFNEFWKKEKLRLKERMSSY